MIQILNARNKFEYATLLVSSLSSSRSRLAFLGQIHSFLASFDERITDAGTDGSRLLQEQVRIHESTVACDWAGAAMPENHEKNEILDILDIFENLTFLKILDIFENFGHF